MGEPKCLCCRARIGFLMWYGIMQIMTSIMLMLVGGRESVIGMRFWEVYVFFMTAILPMGVISNRSSCGCLCLIGFETLCLILNIDHEIGAQETENFTFVVRMIIIPLEIY